MTHMSDRTDQEVDFYSLLLFVLVIWQSTPNLSSTGNIKQPLPVSFKLQYFLKMAFYFCQIWHICQICLSWKTRWFDLFVHTDLSVLNVEGSDGCTEAGQLHLERRLILVKDLERRLQDFCNLT